MYIKLVHKKFCKHLSVRIKEARIDRNFIVKYAKTIFEHKVKNLLKILYCYEEILKKKTK